MINEVCSEGSPAADSKIDALPLVEISEFFSHISGMHVLTVTRIRQTQAELRTCTINMLYFQEVTWSLK